MAANSMGISGRGYQSVEITLLSASNKTLHGVLNISSVEVTGALQEEEEAYDPDGAAVYVVAVILVYGLSIVLLIGSLAKRKMGDKEGYMEEKQIHAYLTQAPDLREKGAKDNYRQLKKTIISSLVESKQEDQSPTSSYSPEVFGFTMTSSPSLAGRKYGVPPGGRGGGGRVEPGTSRPSETDSFQALLEVDESGLSLSGATDEVFNDDQTSLSSPMPQLMTHPLHGATGGHEYRMPPSPLIPTKYPGHAVPQYYPNEGNQQPYPHLPNTQRYGQGGARGDPNAHQPHAPHSNHLAANAERELAKYENDTKIICDYGGDASPDSSDSGNQRKCRLSMDADGNIWIQQVAGERGEAQLGSPPSPPTPHSHSRGRPSIASSSRSRDHSRSPHLTTRSRSDSPHPHSPDDSGRYPYDRRTLTPPLPPPPPPPPPRGGPTLHDPDSRRKSWYACGNNVSSDYDSNTGSYSPQEVEELIQVTCV